MKTRDLIGIGIGLVISVFLSGCMILGFCMFGITGHETYIPSSSGDPGVLPPDYDRSITLDVPLPESPATMPAHRVASAKKFSFGTGTALTIKKNIPSTEEAPGLAEKIIAMYQGLPADAVLERTDQVFMKKYNSDTQTVEEQYPQYTRVVYRQYVYGFPVMGSEIAVSLGENGELLDISKDWATLEQTGEVPVISAEEAFGKLEARDLLLPVQCSLDGYHITRVQSGYYVETHFPDASAQPVPPDTCTPVWIFYGIKPGTGSEPFPLMINATRG